MICKFGSYVVLLLGGSQNFQLHICTKKKKKKKNEYPPVHVTPLMQFVYIYLFPAKNDIHLMNKSTSLCYFLSERASQLSIHTDMEFRQPCCSSLVICQYISWSVFCLGSSSYYISCAVVFDNIASFCFLSERASQLSIHNDMEFSQSCCSSLVICQYISWSVFCLGSSSYYISCAIMFDIIAAL